MRSAVGALLAVVLSAIAASPARAQVTIDVAKITCGQFLAYSIADPKEIALWLHGYRTGKSGGGTIIETQTLKAHYDQIRTYCLTNQDTSVMQAVETLFGDKK